MQHFVLHSRSTSTVVQCQKGSQLSFACADQALYLCQGNMLVRHLSWQESVAAEQAHLLSSTHNSSSSNSDGKAKQAGHVSQTPTNLASAPHVALNDEFDVVIGTDILYEVRQVHSYGSLQVQDVDTHIESDFSMHAVHMSGFSGCNALPVSLHYTPVTTIVYTLQEAHSQLVAAVLRHRLALHGQALICCAVRDQASLCHFFIKWQ